MTTTAVDNAMAEINREFQEREIQEKARTLGINFIDLSLIPINDDFLRIITEEESKENNIIIFFQIGKKLRIATPTPENNNTKKFIQNLKEQGFIVNINLCSHRSLAFAQEKYKRIKKRNHSVEELEEKALKKAESITKEIEDIHLLGEKFETIQADLALAILNRSAISVNASDIHIESEEKKVRIRARIDGELRTLFHISKETTVNLVRHIKFNANIPPNMEYMPTDGQFSFTLENRKINVRVSALPSNNGESIVLRYLDPQKQNISMEKLGFSPENHQKIQNLIQSREGLILATGPTGSGKTTSLYALLKQVNTPQKKIITLENPIEYEIAGIVQSAIHTEKGYDFANALKSCLRQDPDIILLGEIRDSKTAETALQASMTGHLVLSTLHTNSAIDSIIRLSNLKIPDYLIMSSLKGIISQRLMRKPCPHCSQEKLFTKAELHLIQNILSEYIPEKDNQDILDKIKKSYLSGVGCNQCGNTGYKGRSVVSEVIIIDKTISHLISMPNAKEEILKYLHMQKHKFIAYDAALKIVKGESDIQEAIRVLGRDFSPQKDRKNI